ncbi:MAG: TonB-dependent receptor, partial [Pseudomonadota bacterium]
EDGALGWALSGRYYTYGGDSAWKNAARSGLGFQMGKERSINLNGTVDVNFNENTTAIFRLGYTRDEDGPRPFGLIGAEQNNCFPGYRSGAYYDPQGGLPPFLVGVAPFANIFPNTVTTDSPFQYFCGDLSQFEDNAPLQDFDGTPAIGVERDLIFATALFEHDFGNGFDLNLSMGVRDQTLQTGSDSDHQDGSLFFIPISPFFSIPSANAFLNTTGTSEETDVSLEARVSWDNGGMMQASAGAYYYDFVDESRVGSLARVTSENELGLQLDNKSIIENVAVFATLDFDFTDQLHLALEGRYQEETKGRTEFDASGFASYDNEVTFDDLVYKAILSYDINSDFSTYASYAHGVKPGGINGPTGAAANAEFYQPEEVEAFEIGLKGRVLDRGRFAVSAYFNDISQYQLTTPVENVTGGNVNSVATNQGNAEVLGVELEASYDVSDFIRVGGTYAWTDAEFTSGCDDFQFTLNTGGFLLAPFDRANPPANGTILGSPNGTTPLYDPDGRFTGNLSCDLTGNNIPLTSEHQASVFVQTDFPLTERINGFVNADWTFESSKFVQVHNLMETGETSIFSGQVGVKFDNVRVEIFGRNLFDERTPPAATRWFDLLEGFNTVNSRIPGATSIDRNLTGPRSTFLSYRRGRQIGARVKVDF